MGLFLPPPSGVLTFLTDFGRDDPYVGVMKGAALKSYRDAQLVDITHAVPPQDVRTAAFFTAELAERFPVGTVHVVVVDPGVGTERRGICVAVEEGYFVGPDNGVFESLLARDHREVRAIDLEALRLPAPSATFHGRDVFAPIGGSLARGQFGFRAVGPRVADPVRLEAAPADPSHGQILFVDHFGNAITDIPAAGQAGARALQLGDREFPLRRTYGEVEPGEALALVSSFGTFEIAVRDGDAASRFDLAPGQRVAILTA